MIKKLTQTSHILGLGIDISKSKANICLKEDSKVLENFIVTNDEEGITTHLSTNLGNILTTKKKEKEKKEKVV